MMATPSLSSELTPRQRSAAVVLAQQAARNAVKRQLQRQGRVRPALAGVLRRDQSPSRRVSRRAQSALLAGSVLADCAELERNAQRYPHARELMITADCGGSNGARVRLWKRELQKLADDTGLVIRVHHYPPGTSKWNKIEQPPLDPSPRWRFPPLGARHRIRPRAGKRLSPENASAPTLLRRKPA